MPESWGELVLWFFWTGLTLGMFSEVIRRATK